MSIGGDLPRLFSVTSVLFQPMPLDRKAAPGDQHFEHIVDDRRQPASLQVKTLEDRPGGQASPSDALRRLESPKVSEQNRQCNPDFM